MAERAGVRAAFYNAFGLRPRLEAPNLYLDTSVILHLLLPSGERPEAEELLRRVLDLDWTLTTSTYARMEALERLQESAWVRREVLRRKEMASYSRAIESRHGPRTAEFEDSP